MHTEWFAVDADGHVARFATGEADAMPEACQSLSGSGDLAIGGEALRALSEVIPRGELIYEREGQLSRLGTHWDPRDRPTRMLTFVDDLAPLQDALRAGRAVAVAVTPGRGALWDALEPETWRRLHERSVCQGCAPLWHDDVDLAQLGLFTYGHTCENWISGPYALLTRPATPLKVSQLPGAVTRLAAGVRLELCFLEAPRLQPAEHVRCVSWEPCYLAADGRTVRPLTDDVEAARRDFESLPHAGAMGLVFDPSGRL